MTACRTDGVLLTASLPSYYLDAVYLPAGALVGLDPTVGRIYQAPSFVPASPAAAAAAAALAAERGNYDLSYFTSAAPAPAPFLVLLAVDINASVAITPSLTSPDLSPAAIAARGGGTILGYAVVPWSRGFAATAADCADGSPAASCATLFAPGAPLDAYTGLPPFNYTHYFELWSLSPVYANGWSLLGEVGKVIRVSTARVPWTAPNGTALIFALAGAPGEAVEIIVASPSSSFADPLGGVIRVVSTTLSASGAATVRCDGIGTLASCAVTPNAL